MSDDNVMKLRELLDDVYEHETLSLSSVPESDRIVCTQIKVLIYIAAQLTQISRSLDEMLNNGVVVESRYRKK